MIVARMVAPPAKLAMAQGLSPANAHDTICLTPGIDETDKDEFYGAMDRASARQERIETQLARRQPGERSLVLRGLTSVLMEGRRCPLPTFGYSRDGKKGKLQIEFGLMCDREGRPVAVEMFEGNTADPTSVATAAERLQTRFGLERAIPVGDSGMLTEARIREDLRPAGLDWTSALSVPAIRPLAENGALQPSLFDDRDIAQVTCKEFYSGERPSMGEVLRTKRRPSAPARIRRDAGRRPGRSGRHCRP